MDTNPTFQVLVMPILSAITLSANGNPPVNVCDVDYSPSLNVSVNISSSYDTYHTIENSDTFSDNSVYVVDTRAFELMTIKSFAQKYIENLVPIEESIQKVIDDYFWEML